MTVQEAAEKGITRLRRPMWASPTAYMKIDIIHGRCGSWFRLYDRVSQQVIEEPTPQTFIGLGDTTEDYEAYIGPLDPEDK